ncbi:MAG: UDP-N-acetylmuramoyl-tripeptide--D-alanyl-D-alanine ligase [candidate division WOR-3 bacterium]|nr:UDP-N-acetylmuramoyl-tripeptide--D-alanyl-D-alanine ligase [candidate division WOR-3 bacterium]
MTMYIEMMLKKAVKVMRGKGGDIRNELVRGVSIDSRTVMPGELFFALKGENTDGHQYTNEAMKKGAVAVVVQRRTNVPNEILVNDTLFALGELALYYRSHFSIPIVAITGTNGKTTVKNLVASILSTKFKVLWTKKSYNSLIGLPLMIFEISGQEDYIVLEMGTSNPGEIKRLCNISKPSIGIITNVGPGHIKGLGSIDGVRKEKLSLIESLPEHGIGFVGPGVGKVERKNVVYFSYDELSGINIDESGSRFIYKNTLFNTPLLGINNVYNCLTALTVTERLGIETAAQKEALGKIKPEKGRMEPIRAGDLLIIDDTYNANPASMKSAIDFIKELKRRKILILGDMLELGDESEKYHREIGRYAKECSDLLLTTGVEAENYSGIHFDDSDKLVSYLLRNLRGDEVILVKASRAMKFERIVKKILRRI